jgi:asparagine synthase (glutamine-hydrolysing)
LAYLHPTYFTPDKSILNELNINENEKYVIIRFVSWNATHDFGHKGISYENKLKAIKEFEKYSEHSVIADELYGSSNLQDALLNHFEYKLEHLLKWEDRISMNFSLEARVPFLDYRLVEKTLATESDKLINKGMIKHILREAMRGTLPEKIRVRKDKIGFENPEDEWFKEHIFQKMVKDLLNSNEFNKRGIINGMHAQKLYEKHCQRKINLSKEIWKWINLEIWFMQFID